MHVCDDCNFGQFAGKCVVCGSNGVSDAMYCRECVLLEKDRDGCPKVINVGSQATDNFYGRGKVVVKR